MPLAAVVVAFRRTSSRVAAFSSCSDLVINWLLLQRGVHCLES